MAPRAFVRDSLGLAASQYLARAILLARGLVSAAALGPAGFGGWNVLNLILDFSVYAPLGALHGLDLELPAAAARGDGERAQSMLRAAWGIALAGGVAFAAVVAALLASGTWVASSGWGWGAPSLTLAAAFLQIAIHYHASALRARADFAAVSVGLALQAAVGGAIGIATVWSVGVWGLLWGWLAGGACAIAWMRRSPARPPWWPAHVREGAALAARGLPMFAFFLLALAMRSFDRVALARFAGNQALGYYSLGLAMLGLVLYLPEAAAAVLFPRVTAAARGARDVEATRREVVRAHRSLAVLLPVLVGPAVLVTPALLRVLLPAFGPSFASLRILGLAALALSMGTLPSYYLLGTGFARTLLAVVASTATLTAVAVFGTVAVSPQPVPVAWAVTGCYTVFAIAMLALAAPRLAPVAAERAALWGGTLAPTAWATVLVLALSGAADATAFGVTWRSVAFLAAYAPLGFALGRRLGIATALRGLVAKP